MTLFTDTEPFFPVTPVVVEATPPTSSRLSVTSLVTSLVLVLGCCAAHLSRQQSRCHISEVTNLAIFSAGINVLVVVVR
jgi:hypothetical protein